MRDVDLNIIIKPVRRDILNSSQIVMTDPVIAEVYMYTSEDVII